MLVISVLYEESLFLIGDLQRSSKVSVEPLEEPQLSGMMR